jgi:hypothetical protein
MPIDKNQLLSLWDLENMALAQRFLEAAGDCVDRLGIGRTSGTRAALLSALTAMETHSTKCDECNEV